ncbi:MAG: hypothetical protein RIS22_1250 [Actinomycetota bacterium]
MYFLVADVQQKVRTVSRKSERLVNLTIALLATKRYLTKSEIFHSVDGYEGSHESKERMFERDKDDLRSLGIEIEVGSFDPLFNDEAGYRIKRESYELNLGEVSPLEVSLLSLASSAWQGASLSSAAQSAFVKLASLGIPIDELDLPGIAPVLPDAGPEIASITRAIAEHRILEFTYLNSELQREVREIVPTGLKSNNGFWYLSGVDQAIQEKRTFRLDRILGDFSVGKVQKDFDFADEKKAGDTYDAVKITFFAIVDVRQGKCAALRVLATDIKRIGEWDQLTIPILNIDTLTSLILWHGEDAFVQQPIELREQIIYRLQSLVSNHA